MTIQRTAALAALAATTLFGSALAQAQDSIKIGLIAPFSGPFADYGKQMEGGIKAYMALHGDTVAGKKIQIIIRTPPARRRKLPSAWRKNWWCATRSISSPASA